MGREEPGTDWSSVAALAAWPRGELDDYVALSLLAECAQQRKDLALERVVGRRHLNELALWMMLICNMLVSV